MTPRDNGSGFDANRFADRLEKRDEALRVRLENLFDGVDARLARIERDVGSEAQARHAIVAEVAELRRDLGEAREGTGILAEKLDEHIRATAETAGVAVDVATKAENATGAVFARLARALALQRGTALGVAFCAVAWLVTEAPGVIRFLNAWGSSLRAFWIGLGK